MGVHADVEVALGYDWRGGVSDGAARIAQVFNSTIAAGNYGRLTPALSLVAEQLLRAAYLGTLLAAAALARSRAVLTLIGGGVFGNPLPTIWGSLLWAVERVEELGVARDLHVFVNGREVLAAAVGVESLAQLAQDRGGVLASFAPDGAVRLRR